MLTFLMCVAVVIALLVGVTIGWVVNAGKIARANAERDLARTERSRSDIALEEARRRADQAQQARAAAEARAKQVEEGREEVRNLFVHEAQQAFQQVSQTLVQMNKTQVDGSLDTKKAEIEGMLTPLREMVDGYRAELVKSEHARNSSYGGLQEQIRGLLLVQEGAQREATRLANALQSPTVRGSWGEISLRRCVELAGMTEYCDFYVQQSVETDEGRRLRPDMLVRLPNNRIIAVDSKAPVTDYALAAQAPDEQQRRQLLASHTRTLKRHVDALSRKEYQAAIGESLDFTVMFLPGEQFLSAAEPDLVEYASARKIYVATPTVLLPLLRAIQSGWKAEKTEENAKRMHDAGVDLFNRFVRVMELFSEVGGRLNQTVKKYNETIRSIDARLWPKGEEMQRLAGSGKELAHLDQLEAVPLESTKLRLTMQNEDGGDVVQIK
jgi:DNA recombination protein RmuC